MFGSCRKGESPRLLCIFNLTRRRAVPTATALQGPAGGGAAGRPLLPRVLPSALPGESVVARRAVRLLRVSSVSRGSWGDVGWLSPGGTASTS